VIRSFRDPDSEALFNRKSCPRFRSFEKIALKRLRTLDAAHTLRDVAAVPGHHLEKLLGDRQGQHSIRINHQWRICFEWREPYSYNVEIVDYH
jgi:proteic killer suppression protein